MRIEFKPVRIPETTWFGVEIFREGRSIGYLHFIESTLLQICRVSEVSLAKPIAETEGTIQATCNELDRMFKAGEIK